MVPDAAATLPSMTRPLVAPRSTATTSVPPVVIQQARQRLRLLERQMLRRECPARAAKPQLGLFSALEQPVVAALAEHIHHVRRARQRTGHAEHRQRPASGVELAQTAPLAGAMHSICQYCS